MPSSEGISQRNSGAIEVIQSPNDKKTYRYIVLENGLRVLLISDPEMQNGSAAGDDSQLADGGMEVEGEEVGGKAEVGEGSKSRSGGSAGKGKGHGARAGGGGGTAVDGEESSGDLMSDDGEGDEGEEVESGSGSDEGDEDEEMASGEGSSEESGGGKGEDEDEEGEGEDGGCRGGRGGGRGKKGGAHKAPVKKAAAAMAVGVGSFSDPEDLQGLSHYLEHMLFMGSIRYPAENEYDDFLSCQGGASNAFTDLEVTNFHFEVAPAHLAGALDRFAQFFIAPLCREGSLEREVLAVDSEFCQVLQDDHCRLLQIMCHTARHGHIYRKFSWGNKTSLWDQPRMAGLDVRRRLLEYYNQHYGADRSCLVVLGGEDLDVLARMVEDSFGAMPTGRGPQPSFANLDSPFEGRCLHVLPAVRDSHELRITFQMPPLQRLYSSKADSYISHLLGHEGAGSLLSALKARGWASEILAGVDDDGYSSNSLCSMFGVDITLTEAGLAAGPGGCGLAVVQLVFAYINMMQREGPQEWVWHEMRAVSEQRWRFLEEGDPLDTVSRLAGAMHIARPEHTLVSEYLHETWNPELVVKLMERMEPAGQDVSYRIDLLTRRYDEVKSRVLALASRAGVEAREEKEPWFGLEVVVMQLPQSLCESWAHQAPFEELRMPPRNPYLPSDFSLRCEEPSVVVSEPSVSHLPELPLGVTSPLATTPVILLDRPGLRLWHKLDTKFRTPRAAVHWRLFSPAGHTSARAAACSHLSLQLVEEALREDAYLADVAGLHYHTSPEGLAGMEFRVDGFSDRLGMLVGRLAGALAGLTSAAATPLQEGAACGGSGGEHEGEGASEGPAAATGNQSMLTLTASALSSHFSSVREALVRKYRNMNMEVGQHASYSRLFVLCSRALHCDEIRKHLEELTPQDIPPFVTQLLSKCHVEAFVHGNVTSADAVQLAETVVSALGPGCTMDAEERLRDQCVVVPAAAEAVKTRPELELGSAPLDVGTVVSLRTKNPKEANAALEVYFQLGPTTDPRDRAVLDLIDQILYEPCYDTLRTKQQLGYSVYSGTRLTGGVSGFCVQVVSARYPPEQLDACVESFLTSMGPRIRDLNPGELSKHVGALVASKMQRDRSLVDEAGRLWGHISSQRYDFFSRELEVAALEAVTVKDVYDTFVRHLLPASARAPADSTGGGGSERRKLSVQIRPHGPLAAAKDKTAATKEGPGGDDVAENKDASATVAAVVGTAATPLPPMSEPGDLLSLRSQLPLHALHLGKPLPPVLL